MNLYTKYRDIENKQSYSYQRGLGVREEQIRSMGLTDTLLLICQINKQQGFTVKHREFYSVSCNNL